MKKTILLAFLISTKVFALNSVNASSQGESTCDKAALKFADLVLGESSMNEISSKKTTLGVCDGETCNPDSTIYSIRAKNIRTPKPFIIEASGVDSSGRCLLNFK
jgi:hypothetical protein